MDRFYRRIRKYTYTQADSAKRVVRLAAVATNLMRKHGHLVLDVESAWLLQKPTTRIT